MSLTFKILIFASFEKGLFYTLRLILNIIYPQKHAQKLINRRNAEIKKKFFVFFNNLITNYTIN